MCAAYGNRRDLHIGILTICIQDVELLLRRLLDSSAAQLTDGHRSCRKRKRYEYKMVDCKCRADRRALYRNN